MWLITHDNDKLLRDACGYITFDHLCNGKNIWWFFLNIKIVIEKKNIFFFLFQKITAQKSKKEYIYVTCQKQVMLKHSNDIMWGFGYKKLKILEQGDII